MVKLGMDHIEVKALRREALATHVLGIMASLDEDAIEADAWTTSTFKTNFAEFTKRVAESHSSLLSCRQGTSLLKDCYIKGVKDATNASMGRRAQDQADHEGESVAAAGTPIDGRVVVR